MLILTHYFNDNLRLKYQQQKTKPPPQTKILNTALCGTNIQCVLNDFWQTGSMKYKTRYSLGRFHAPSDLSKHPFWQTGSMDYKTRYSLGRFHAPSDLSKHPFYN